MTPQQYLLQELEGLREFNPKEIAKENLADEVYRLLMSKKFRKYAANEQLTKHIKSAIALNIQNNQPINVTFPHGAYKLWRLTQAPLPEWAELFATMYYTKWLKPICEIYKPGVWFDFFVDDLILPKIDNVPLKDVEAYIEGFQNVLDFLKQFQPENMKMTITKFESLFPSREAFDKKLQDAVEKFKATNPTFTDAQKKVVALNAHPTDEQLEDPQWIEKVLLVHDAYIGMKREIGYYFQPEKIAIFNQPLASGKFLALGTTKTSIAKFWVGIGALKKTENGYQEYILSPQQIQTYTLTKEAISIEGLSNKNFHSINIFS